MLRLKERGGNKIKFGNVYVFPFTVDVEKLSFLGFLYCPIHGRLIS